MADTDLNQEQHEEMTKKIDGLSSRFDQFIIVYELDMRGDKKVNNGNPGMVGTVRDIRKGFQKHLKDHESIPTPISQEDWETHLEEHKKERKEYPSLTYLLKNYPAKTIAAILTTFILLNALLTAGILQAFATVFGVPAHIP